MSENDRAMVLSNAMRENCKTFEQLHTQRKQYTNPGLSTIFKRAPETLVYPADFWNTREMREI